MIFELASYNMLHRSTNLRRTYFLFRVNRSNTQPVRAQRRWELFLEGRGGVRVLGLPTSKCSNFTTTGPYSCRFHSRDNDDLYLTNLTHILKFHVDFRVIVEPAGWRHPIYQKVRNWLRSANKPLSSAKTFKNQQNKPL